MLFVFHQVLTEVWPVLELFCYSGVNPFATVGSSREQARRFVASMAGGCDEQIACKRKHRAVFEQVRSSAGMKFVLFFI